jgi:hypothetical protein
VKCQVCGTKTGDSSFTDKGFNYWKEGATKIYEHSLSKSHRAAANFVAQKNRTSVAAQLNTQLLKDQEVCRKRLVAELNVIMFLMQSTVAYNCVLIDCSICSARCCEYLNFRVGNKNLRCDFN